MAKHDGEVLLVIDAQNDFCPGGRLAVPKRNFRRVGLTQNWHREGHSSFASRHPGKAPLSEIAMPYGPQTLWPDHCIWETQGAEFRAASHGFDTIVIEEACRAIDLGGTAAQTRASFRDRGIKVT